MVVVTDITIDDRQVTIVGDPVAELPLTTQLLTVNGPKLKIPVELPLKTQLLTVNVPWLLAAPVPELLLMMLLATVMEAP